MVQKVFQTMASTLWFLLLFKGNRTIADLRYGQEDSISPSTLIFAAIKS